MSRRWMISSSSLVICTALVAVASGQSPSLSERFKQLRSGWGNDESASEAAAPEAAATPAPERRSMLPKVDPRSLLPNGLFGRATEDENDDVSPEAVTVPGLGSASQPRAGSVQSMANANGGSKPLGPVAAPNTATPTAGPQRPASNARTMAPIASPVAASRPSTTPTAPPARRSPEQRIPPNFDSESLRNELSSSFATEPTPADEVSTTSPAGTSTTRRDTVASQSAPDGATRMEPTISDDFAAGLEREAAEIGRAFDRPGTAADGPSPSDTITLQPRGAARRTAGRPQVSSGGSSTFPTVGGLAGRKSVSRFVPESTAPTAPDINSSVIVSDGAAQKAFEPGAKSNFSLSAQPIPSVPTASNSRYGSNEITPIPAETVRRDSFNPPAGTAAMNGVLVTNQAPAISSDIRGPQQIMIGREATYDVRLQNKGASAAADLVATVRVPSWADVVTTSASQGIVRQGDSGEPSGALEWHIPELAPNAVESLTLKLIPRASRPLELGITWTHAPVDARTIVEVQEPKLRMTVAGPDEVLWGKPHVYRLTISNPGTGSADNVKIDLLPPGGGRETVSSHTIGSLQPGETKTVDVELTARDAGKLNVEAVATADGGLTSEATKELFCRKPELEVDWRGPETQYAGTPATYFFRVRNPGTAAADDVAVRVALPAGTEFVSASEGYDQDRTAGEIVWRVGTLGPGDDCYMELRCVANTAGENQLRVIAATSDGDLSDNKLAATKVVALADLKLDVSDPAGPVLVGDEAIYEIRVTNRGSNAAEEVNVVGLFSAGLEPETVDGSTYTATDGRVSFRTIRKLPAGQNVVLQIRAKATQAGTHVFRAEVLCRDLEIKLAAEETTRFYDNQLMHESAASSPTVIGSRDGGTARQ